MKPSQSLCPVKLPGDGIQPRVPLLQWSAFCTGHSPPWLDLNLHAPLQAPSTFAPEREGGRVAGGQCDIPSTQSVMSTVVTASRIHTGRAILPVPVSLDPLQHCPESHRHSEAELTCHPDTSYFYSI